MESVTRSQRVAWLGIALAVFISYGTANGAAKTAATASPAPSMVPNPCDEFTEARPSAPPGSNLVLTKEQLVFDLCRASAKLDPILHEDMWASERRFRTIAAEARLMGNCVEVRTTGDPWNERNFLAHHDFGCGPFDPATPKPDAPTTTPIGDGRVVCDEFAKGTDRPTPTPPNSPHGLGMHGPITYAEVAFDTCYAASVVRGADAIAHDGRLGPEVSRLIDKLEYESFELNHCNSLKEPDTTSTDFARDRNLSCGAYSSPTPTPSPKPSPSP